MGVRFTRWNASALTAKVATTLGRIAPVYVEETTLQISNPLWDWNWDTLREESLLMGGETEPGLPGVIVKAGKRDIVDTGRLLDSITAPLIVRRGNTATLSIAWTAPYAKRVLEGGVYGTYVNVRGEIVSVGQRPARNWIQAAYDARPPEKAFANAWLKFKATK